MSKKKQPLLRYLEALQAVRRTQKATPETSFYGALQNLLTEIGEDFDPELFASPQLKNDGSGAPDFGIFDNHSTTPRLVVEVKPTKDDIYDTASGKQVSKYWGRYGFVLVTNFREFLLVARVQEGVGAEARWSEPRVELRYRISPTSEAFWRSTPAALAKEHEQGLTDFLEGVFARPSPITRPRDLAADLARYAREAKRRLARHSIDDLKPLQDAFESALGLSFEDAKGLDFFRSSLVQTLFYGLFSGWMLWRQALPKGKKPPVFDWKDASDYLALPLIGDLFDEVAKPKRLGELGLREPLEWAANSLNRVHHAEFFGSFDADHAITLFYEPFLQAFDPDLRKQLGVWYTPPEIVTYMVERVDQLLRSELGIENGLADESVYVLDPATGTGSYVVEVAKRIHKTLEENGAGPLAAAGVKKALTTRVFGFEILPAPYVVAHLQLGVLLRGMGAPLSGKDRAGVYLTNALTGWEPPKGAKQSLAFPFLQDEQDKAATVKRDKPIIVILGNPPYNRFAGVAEAEEADLIDPYKKGLHSEWGIRKQLLDDLYIRFFRLGEKRIGEIAKRGIVCYISNYSWLDGLSHPVMRGRILSTFDSVYIDNCNGDKYKTGKRTPDGKPDESMFTTDDHRVGIQVGTAIATMVARGTRGGALKKHPTVADVFYRQLWGTGNAKRSALLDSVSGKKGKGLRYSRVKPSASARWLIAPPSGAGAAADYSAWPNLPGLFPVYYSGLNENRQGALISVDRQRLEDRMKLYFNRSAKDAEVSDACPELMDEAAGYDPRKVRDNLLGAKVRYDANAIVPLSYRPLDDWFVYWHGESKLLNRSRPDFQAQCWKGNMFIAASQTARKGGSNEPLVVDKFGDLHLQDPWSQFFPLRIRQEGMLNGDALQPNIDHAVLAAVCTAAKKPLHGKDGHAFSPDAYALAESVFFHTLGVLWSPAYRKENEAALRQDWPRVPIPKDPALLNSSAMLGRTVADLLLPDKPVPGVTSGKLRAELKTLATHAKVGGKPIDPDKDLEVTATWGFRGQNNAVMSGKGKVLPNDADPDAALDIYINGAVCWRNVPRDVWEMTIGGYPVVKKWLSYREKRVLGRALKMEEMTYITEVVRRLKALLLLGPELDANYRACAKETITLSKKV